MTVDRAVALRHRIHLYKALACVVLALVALQYLLSVLDRRSIETIFAINATRYADHSYDNHPRGLIIYGPAPSTNYSEIVNVSASTTISRIASEAPKSGSNDVSKSTDLSSPSTSSEDSGLVVPNVTESSVVKACPLVPPNLVGQLEIFTTIPSSNAMMEKTLGRVKPGGRGWPSDCTALHRVAIIIPYRDRLKHLQTLLYNLHPILLRQQIDYQIFVVEQEGTGPFNRASLMNVGYKEALKERTFDCFIFHDVDLVPENDRNLYVCPDQPRHMSVAIDKFHYRLPYAELFGGVSALTREQFQRVNGFSNAFWGWGGEDDDMASRIKAQGYYISRYPVNVARYTMLTHSQAKANPKRYEILNTSKKRFTTDGLSNLRYDVVERKMLKLYTLIIVRLTSAKSNYLGLAKVLGFSLNI